MSTSSPTRNEQRKNDAAWARFFDETDTLSQVEAIGHCYITAAQLNSHAGREARLLAKQDTLHDRPEVFRKHGLAIFPVKNGEYVLFRDPDNKTYFRFEQDSADPLPSQHESELPLTAFEAFPGLLHLNESQALDFALVSSLLRTFTGDKDLYFVIRGRTFSGDFQFHLPHSHHRVNVSSVQIEIDGGYESQEAIYLIEAKTGRRDDFNIRQLYYPYLEWKTRVAARSRKRVVPIFFYVTNGKFYFSEFEFNEAFGDLKVRRTASYTLNEPALARINLADVLTAAADEGEPVGIPFPQADDLDKIVDLLAYLDTEKDPERAGKEGLAAQFDFDARQSDYYANAAAYLGLLRRRGKGAGFELTSNGALLVGSPSLVRRTELLVRQMAKRPVLRDVFALLQGRNLDPQRVSSGEIEAVIARRTTLGGSTPKRRTSTVRSWLRWLKRNAILT